MTVVRDRRPARRARELLIAAWGAVLLVLAFSLPVLGAPPGPTKLLSPDVSPREADSATPVTFTVTYWNAHALPPDYVRVAVGGRTYPMTGAGTDWKAGVVFSVTTKLPAGTHEVRFEARDAERFVDELVAGSVAIDAAPAPTPTPDPDPDPTPTPSPTEPPDPGTSGGSGAGGGSTGGSTDDGSTGSGTGTGSIDAIGWDDLRGTGRGPAGFALDESLTEGDGSGGTGTSGGTGGSSGASTGGSTGGGSSSTDAIHKLPWFIVGLGTGGSGGTDAPGSGGGTGGGAGGSGTGGSGEGDGGSTSSSGDSSSSGASGSGGPVEFLQSFTSGLAAVGLSGSGQLPTLPAVVGSSLLVTTWMAFAIFSKRRRDAEPPAPDGLLQAAASTGIGMGLVMAPTPVAPPDPEAMMPRWRRPSLLEARKTDPIRSPGPERPRLTFSIGETAAPRGGERRIIRYAVIPLLDRPDEILATRIGELVAGDEVQVEQRSGAYCHVLCPDGRQGWVHRTTLGDPVEAPDRGYGRTPEPEPEAENALAAMLAARGIR
ncbi:MAG: SH3 domain-containing protein [Chloroflexi bacterium]|nr:SH3 domain-containing protein [Chloroflexota bacterium]